MTEALVTFGLFAVPVFFGGLFDQMRIEKEQKERDERLLREQLTQLACERAVKADRMARVARIRQSLVDWEPIEWDDEVSVRKARKWGRHAK